MTSAISPPPRDATLSRYRLVEEVARGGMGEIWRGEHPDTGQPVAIKRLSPAILELDARGAADEYRSRLLREAAVLRDLTHPNIVRCLDAGHDDDGRPFVVLEWLEGEDLADRQARAPLSVGEVVEVARQALSGLSVCHAQGLVHRDIKPPNIFLAPAPDSDPGFQIKLLDFGVALPSAEATRLTQIGAVVGTLHYLAPEQARGDPVIDGRTDLYALGVVLYELLTGRVPFSAQQPAAVLFKIVAEIPTPPSLIDERVPPALEAIVLRAMSRAAGDRFQTAEEMAAAVAALAEPEEGPRDASVPAAPKGPTERRLVSLLCIEPPAGVADAEPRVRDVVAELGGTAKRLADGKLVVAFGLEQTSGDEPLRCVRAGLRVRELLGAGVKIEAAAAHVESGGGGVRIDTGDLDRTLHLLPRLPVGELIIDPSTRQQLGDQVTVSRAGELFAVSGLDLERAGIRAVLGARPPTVGRDAELAALRARVEGVVEAKEPDAVVVHGPPGMGKSRMLQELLPELRGRSALCLEARPDSSRAETPYSLLAEALRREAGIQAGQPEAVSREALQTAVQRIAPALAQDTPEALWFLGEALGLPFEDQPALRVARADPKVMRRQVLQAFEALFEAAGQRGLITLCLDDLQWGDEESLQICEHLLEHLDQTPLFVLACCRPELLERRPELFAEVEALHQEARPLGKRSLRKLMEAILGGAVPQEVERLVREQWAGNPFYAEEIVSWMVSGGVLARSAGGWELQGDPSALRIPASLQAAIQQRLDHLPAALKDLTKAAAVFGVELWEDGCVSLGFTDASARLRELEQAAFVMPVSTSRIANARQWRFKHGLLQQAAYEMLLHDQRADLHLRVGAWLEAAGEQDGAVLGRHFALGGEVARAADCFARAGARSLADGELEGAVRFYEQSLEGEPAPDDRASRTLELTRALYLLGNGERGLAAVRGLFGESLGRDHLARARWLEGRLLFATAQYDSAERALFEAQDALPSNDEEGLAFEIDQTLFWVTFARGRYDEATELAEQIHGAALRGGRPEQLCTAKLAVAYSNVVAGDLSVAVSLAGEAVELAREIRHPYREVDSLLLLGSSLETAGLYDEALERLDAAYALATQLKTVHQQASIEASRGRVHLLRGEQAEALERYREAARLAGELGDDRVLADGLLGQARALTSSPQRAEALACRALMTAEGRAPAAEAEAHAVLASLELAGGRVEEAVKRARAATALVKRLGGQEQCEAEILLTAHDALAAAGRDEEARAVLEQAREGIERKAASISDEGVRRAFLERVPHHVRVRRLATSERGE